MLIGCTLAITTQKRVLRVTVWSSVAVKMENRMLGIIKKGIEKKMENAFMTLYKAMVYPHLEYCMLFLSYTSYVLSYVVH